MSSCAPADAFDAAWERGRDLRDMLPATVLRVAEGRLLAAALAACVCFAATSGMAVAQAPLLHHGEVVPRDVREMYDRGLQYLAGKQTENGDWNDGQNGPGTTGMALMAFLASGEDPNFGRYRNHVRRALRSIISAQDATTGYMGSSMYHHGFAMLALAEAYGAVDDRDLWPAGQSSNRRSIGAALELAVREAVTSQKKNPLHAWRYSPDATDADTSVSGAVLVGLLAARNAGIEVPDTSIDKAIAYYKSMTSDSGQVAYSGLAASTNRPRGSPSRRWSMPWPAARICRSTKPRWRSSCSGPNKSPRSYREYGRYYQAQALFQGNIEAWEKWNKQLIRQLKASQQSDGSFPGQFGQSTGTSMSLLALALNYRLLPIYER